MNHLLAIIIPVYKGKFLSQTLQSLAEQTVQNFHVYIGDDNSPDNIQDIVLQFRIKLNITYKRFDNNLGRTDLVAHWKRCIEMPKGEEWYWLLPDDDMASPECVEVFFEASKNDSEKEKLYRFQTVHIGEDNKILKNNSLCPPLESNVDFIIGKLRFERNSSVAEYIFSKSQYHLIGGFTSLPLAWGSDDLLWVSLSQEHDVVSLPKGLVSLRQSELNISNNTRNYVVEKFQAKYEYLKLLLNNRDFMKKLLNKYTLYQFKDEMTKHLFFEYKSYGLDFLNCNLFLFAKRNNQLLGGGYFKNIYRLLRFQFSK
jgi:glycosyltransferase involved in cell wall biosynthesis